MSKREQNNDRSNEEKANLYRDSKRRLIYPIEGTDTAYVINPGKEGFVFAYDSRFAFSLFPIALLYGVLNFNLILSALLGIVIYAAMTIYFKKFYISKFRTIKMKEEDVAKTQKPQVLKSKRNERYIRFLMGFLVTIIIISKISSLVVLNQIEVLELVITGIMALAILVVSAIELRDGLRYNKQYKEARKESK